LYPRTAHDAFIFVSDCHDFGYTMEGEFIDLIMCDFVGSVAVLDLFTMIAIGAEFFSLDLDIT